MRAVTKSIVPFLAVVLLAAACGGGEEAAPASEDGASVRPAVVTDIGGLGDRGFNDLAKKGLDEASAELGVEGQIIEPGSPTDYAPNLAQLAETGLEPVFGIGFSFADAMSTTAPQYPDTFFGIVDAEVDEPNVVSLLFREQEGSYLAGVVAGLMTQEDTDYTNPADRIVGFIGGAESPLIEKFEAGYTQGVRSVCPDCQVLSQYIGGTAEAFRDPAAAAEIARIQRAGGADIIYHAAGGSGAGLFDVATSEQFFAIGVNTDQAPLFPEAPILTSMLKKVDEVVAATILRAAEGEVEGGTISSGLAEQAIDLAGFGQFDELVPDSVRDELDEARAGIVDGTVEVPTTMADVDA